MIVTLILEKRIYSLTLPEKKSGKYWITGIDEGIENFQFMAVEGTNGNWVLHSSPILKIIGENNTETNSIVLDTKLQVISLLYSSSTKRASVVVEPISEDRQLYNKFLVTSKCRLNIGRTDDNQIVISNRYVSSHHACLVWNGEQWVATDLQSGNGTFANEVRVTSSPLKWGDTLYLMGVKIIVGNGFISVNNPDGSVVIQGSELIPLPNQVTTYIEALSHTENDTTFYRAPRFFREVTPYKFKIDAPPAMQIVEPMPAMLLFGPALTMGMTAVVMGSISLWGLSTGTTTFQAALPSMTMCVSMLSATLLWAPLTRRHERKLKEKNELKRQKRYIKYLDEVREEIYTQSSLQKDILQENSPTLEDCSQRILSRMDNLWERNPEHFDFLSLRLGIGCCPLQAEFHFPDNRFVLDDDTMLNEVKRLQAEPKILKDIPIHASLLREGVTGIHGESGECIGFLNAIILQIVSLHSCDEVKLVVVGTPEFLEYQSHLRWLPHTWDNNQKVHYLIKDEMDGKVIGANIEGIRLDRKETSRNLETSHVPHYIILAFDMNLASKIDLFQEVCHSKGKLGFTALCFASELRGLPKECTQIVTLNNDKSFRYLCSDTSGHKDYFIPDKIEQIDMLEIALSLANLPLDYVTERYSLPNMLSFLDLYGVGKVEHLNARSRWTESNPVHTLQALVGVGLNGENFYLDLHEKYHGPHGLIAGMTGSGKSEFIVSYILSMAVNYHPDEVSFILIDYKGGGLTGAFENVEDGVSLPHLAGTITNLDGASIKRSLICIQSELLRRQNIFNQVKQQSNEGTVDIYKYQTMYRSGLVSEPIPHLLIVSDEFAELKAQQPEFMDQLISAARIGRSLGVHLILATQKPSGVVNDQIWSNSRFRVCLKVQEKADSMDMLKRPEATEISNAGRFFLQVGYNEIFEQGQSAWCGAPYNPVDMLEESADLTVTIQSSLGQVLSEARPAPKNSNPSNSSQAVEVVKYLSSLANDENISAQKLWLPIIPNLILLDSLKKKYNWIRPKQYLESVVGEFDDPTNQTQELLTLPFTENGNVVLYGTLGSGKGTFLNSMLCGLVAEYPPELLHIYLVDMGEETLSAYQGCAQVGDIMLSADADKINNLFKLLEKEITLRKKKFAKSGGGYALHFQQEVEIDIPHILVVIRNYSAFVEQFELLENNLVRLLRESAKFGIYFLITADSCSDIRPRLARSLPQVIALQLHEHGDFVSLFGKTDGVYPSQMNGRGLIRREKVLEFQTAQFAEVDSYEAVVDYCAKKSLKGTCFAQAVPSLPNTVTTSFFGDEISLEKFPIGVEKNSLRFATLDLSSGVVSLILAKTRKIVHEMSSAVITQLTDYFEEEVILWDGENTFGELSGVIRYSGTFEDQVEILFNEAVRRNNTYKSETRSGKPLPHFPLMIYVISDISAIFNSLGEDRKDKLRALLEEVDRNCNIRIILIEGSTTLREQANTTWFTHQMISAKTIWVGDGIAEQSCIRVNNSYQLPRLQPNNQFGFFIQDGDATIIKVLSTEESQEEYYE